MINPPNFPQDLIQTIQRKYIIIIVGEMGSGKTTEACLIASILKKQTKVIIQHEHNEDAIMFEKYGFEKIIVDSTSKNRKSLKPALKEFKDGIVIYDDFQSSTSRHEKTIKDISIDLRKRNMQLILIYHGEDISKQLIKRKKCFLIVKKDSGISRYKFGQYFNLNGIATSAEEFCKKIKNYDTVYVKKNGEYFHRDGNTNNIIKDKFKSKTKKEIDRKKLIDLIINQKKTQTQAAKKLKVSKSRVSKEIKILKEENKKFSKLYQNLKRRNLLSQKNKIGKLKKCGIAIFIEYEQLVGKSKKNKQKIQQINKIKNIGDEAVEIIGKCIQEAFEDIIKKPLEIYVEILIRLGRGGADIEISFDNRIIEIEVKNYSKNKKNKHLTKSVIEKKVFPRFSKNATEKWLFTCGLSCNKIAKNLLKQNNIKYKIISNLQINKEQKNEILSIKKKMHKFVSDFLGEAR
jgi:energy-coupling factor transporter ATP-binding protein EcfA2